MDNKEGHRSMVEVKIPLHNNFKPQVHVHPKKCQFFEPAWFGHKLAYSLSTLYETGTYFPSVRRVISSKRPF